MNRQGLRFYAGALLAAAVFLFCASHARAQAREYERSFPQSKTAVEKAVKDLQPSAAGRLPVLEGFASSSEHPLDHYRRGYYQAKFQITALPTGGATVRVSVQVTAWYSDPSASRSGYQVLTSNGRLESDLLDQLTEQLSSQQSESGVSPATAEKRGGASKVPSDSTSHEPTISAPVPRIPETRGGLSSSLAQSLSEQESGGSQKEPKKLANKDPKSLQAEAESLEEILKNQAHPKNLVAVKKSGTPVVATASLTAKTLFLASAHDEFEMLEFNRDWVHVKISGLSRGWIWRNNLEMPEGIPDSDLPVNAASVPVAADLFHVSREEKAPFPGDWAPLRGKSVKIVSVENTNDQPKDSGAKPRLEFVKSLLDKNYAELSQPSQELAGLVVIFDSADGGMIAATLATIQQWKAGTLSDAALWHQCFFDPPETFSEPSSSASQ